MLLMWNGLIGLRPYQFFKGPTGPRAMGTVVVLVLVVVTLTMLELALMGLVLTRGLGEEASLSSHNVAVQQALDTGFSRMTETLKTYLESNDKSTVTTGAGGTPSIAATPLTVTNPEGGATTYPLQVSISAWVASRRGYFYQLSVRAQTDNGIDITQSRWVELNPCSSSGQLTVIESTPGEFFDSMAVDSQRGRLFFGDENSFETWAPETGLSVIVAGLDHPGILSTVVDPTTGRVFFGEQGNSGHFRSWHPSTGLSVLTIAAQKSPGVESTAINTQTGRVFWGCNNGACPMYTWHSSTGLSALTGAINDAPGYRAILVDSQRNRVFWGAIIGSDTNKFYTWAPGPGLSTYTITGTQWNGQSNGAQSGMALDSSTGRLYFTSTNVAASIRSWHATTGLSIHYTSTSYLQGLFWHPTLARLFFSDSLNGVYTWKSSTGLSLISNTGNARAILDTSDPTYQGVVIANADRLSIWTVSGGYIYTFTGGGAGVASEENIAVTPDGHVFFGELDPGARMMMWSPSDGEVEIANGLTDPGAYGHIAVDPINNRLFFGEGNSSTGAFYTWEGSTGLSQLLSELPFGPDQYRSVKVDSRSGRVFFAGYVAPTYTWNPYPCKKGF